MSGGASRAKTLFLLDTSAIFALLEDEPGAARVEHILREEEAILPFVVALEVYYISLQERGEQVAAGRHAMLRALPLRHINDVSEAVVLTAGRFKAKYPISLADALIAAVAHEQGAILVHKDPEYQVLHDQVRLEALPHKPRRKE